MSTPKEHAVGADLIDPLVYKPDIDLTHKLLDTYAGQILFERARKNGDAFFEKINKSIALRNPINQNPNIWLETMYQAIGEVYEQEPASWIKILMASSAKFADYAQSPSAFRHPPRTYADTLYSVFAQSVKGEIRSPESIEEERQTIKFLRGRPANQYINTQDSRIFFLLDNYRVHGTGTESLQRVRDDGGTDASNVINELFSLYRMHPVSWLETINGAAGRAASAVRDYKPRGRNYADTLLYMLRRPIEPIVP